MQKGPSGTRLLPGARCCGDISIVVTYLSPTPVPGGGKEAGVVFSDKMTTSNSRSTHVHCSPKGVKCTVRYWCEHGCDLLN